MTPAAAPPLDFETQARELIAKIEHGDEKHRQWLRDVCTPLIVTAIQAAWTAAQAASAEERDEWFEALNLAEGETAPEGPVTAQSAQRLIREICADLGKAQREVAASAERIATAEKKSDEEMLRVKACEHIACGDEGWERLRNECPSTVAVASLRDALAESERRREAAEKMLAALQEHTRELKLAAGRHRLAVHALGRIKNGKTLFEGSPTKDQECFEAWKELNNSGAALDALVTFPTAGILDGARHAARAKEG